MITQLINERNKKKIPRVTASAKATAAAAAAAAAAGAACGGGVLLVEGPNKGTQTQILLIYLQNAVDKSSQCGLFSPAF